MTPTHRGILGAALLLASGAATAHAQRPAYFFGELGGPGGLASVNLEANPVGPLRTRLGAGLFLFWPSIPLTATATLGSEHHALEIGLGATVVIVPAESAHHRNELFDWGNPSGTRLVGSGVVGYRFSPRSGWLFRVAVTPLYDTRRAVFWLGVSLGHRL